MEDKIFILKQMTKEINEKRCSKGLFDDRVEDLDFKFITDFVDYILILISEADLNICDKESYLTRITDLKICNYDSVFKLDNRLDWLKKMNLTHLGIGLRESHDLILQIFDEINLILNAFNIDYYHTSGILTYLLTGQDLVRYHHDLDIFVNESDLARLFGAISNSNFRYEIFLGERSTDTRRRVIKLYYKGFNIPISIFAFERLSDGAVVVNDYFFDTNNNLFATQDYNSPRCTMLSFSQVCYMHNNIPYHSITLEALYSCKEVRMKEKDLYDLEVMKKFVDFERLREISLEMTSITAPFRVVDDSIQKSMIKLLERKC